jgi:predicted metal-dependent hydrolase
MTVIEEDGPPRIDVSGNRIKLYMRPGTPPVKRQAIMEGWYRDELKKALPPLLANWETKLGVKPSKVFVQRMKTKWGSCNHRAKHLRFNSELAKKPKKLLEYIIVHELAHLLEPTHNERFFALLNQHYPNWREVREQLNELPLASEDWRR